MILVVNVYYTRDGMTDMVWVLHSGRRLGIIRRDICNRGLNPLGLSSPYILVLSSKVKMPGSAYLTDLM